MCRSISLPPTAGMRLSGLPAASQNSVVGARKSGKIKAISQAVGVQICFFFLMLHEFYPASGFEVVPWWTMVAVTAITTLSFIDYFFGYLPILKQAWSEKPLRE